MMNQANDSSHGFLTSKYSGQRSDPRAIDVEQEVIFLHHDYT